MVADTLVDRFFVFSLLALVVFFLDRTTLMGSGVLVRVSSTVSYGGKDDRCVGFGKLPLLKGVPRPEPV